MKKKHSFVTNSSSTSFIVIGDIITKEEAIALNFENVVMVFDSSVVIDRIKDLNHLKEKIADYCGDEAVEEVMSKAKFFASYYHSVQYDDGGVQTSKTRCDIPSGTSVYSFPLEQ